MKAWVNDLNTTNFRIVVSIALFAVTVVVVLLGVTVMVWSPTENQIRVVEFIVGAIIFAMGLDVTTFGIKRMTDKDYAAAKKGPSPVNVEAPSSVTVQTPDASAGAPEQPTAVLVAPDPTPAAGRDPQSIKLAGE